MANYIKNNSFSVEIKNGNEWEPISGKPTFPLSRGELLDERLDEAYLTLVDDTRENYSPLTEIRIKGTEADISYQEQEEKLAFRITLDRAIEMGYTLVTSFTGEVPNRTLDTIYISGVRVTESNLPVDLTLVPKEDNPYAKVIAYACRGGHFRNEDAPASLVCKYEIMQTVPKWVDLDDLGSDPRDTYGEITIPEGATVTVNGSYEQNIYIKVTGTLCQIWASAKELGEETLKEILVDVTSKYSDDEFKVSLSDKSYAASRIYYPERNFLVALLGATAATVVKESTVEITEYPDLPGGVGKAPSFESNIYKEGGRIWCDLFVKEQEWYIAYNHSNPDGNFPQSLTYEFLASLTVSYGANLSDAGYLFYVVGRDDSTRNPLTGKWKHSLYLLERTKLLEGIVCPSLTFTNMNGTAIQASAIASAESLVGIEVKPGTYDTDDVKAGISLSYPGASAFPINALSFGEEMTRQYNSKYGTWDPPYKDYYSLVKDEAFAASSYSYTPFAIVETTDGEEVTFTKGAEINKPFTEISSITYCCSIDRIWGVIVESITGTNRLAIKYTVRSQKVSVPTTKKLSITDCVIRVLDLAEPLFTEEIGASSRALPRYSFRGILRDSSGHVSGYLKGSQAEKYSKIIAPEFSMTECTLREQLKIIGSYIHAEPRLDENDEIYFEEYGEVTDAGISDKPYIYSGSSWDVNDYCTEIRTNAKNLTSSLSYASVSCADPSRSLYRSLRSEMQYARITVDDAIIKTEFPIYAIKKVMCGILNEGDSGGYFLDPVDITGFIFENTFYSANLSSYASDGANSRSLALFYTQGEPNIKGLFYRAPTASENPTFSDYAIVSILSLVSSKSLGEIKEAIEGNASNPTATIGRLVFQVSYVPVYAVTATHGKGYSDGTLPRFSKVYNQSEQLVESSYYGENVKGVAQRLGNVEKERTFIVKSVKDIPKTGQMLEGFAISAVSSEINPYYIKCTVGLTKDFNRISEYIGISSIRRMYEISERNVSERNVLIHNTVLLGDKITDVSANDRAITRSLENFVRVVFTGSEAAKYFSPISSAIAQGFPKSNPTCDNQKDKFSAVILPVIPTALGNSMIFSFSYKDNYSAGDRIQFVSNGDVIGYWQNDVPYTNENGKVYWLRFGFMQAVEGHEKTATTPYNIPLISGSVNFFNCALGGLKYPLLLRKDNREKIAITYEIEFKSNRNDIVIGSALASENPLVKDVSESGIGEARIIFNTGASLNKFVSGLDVSVENRPISLCCIKTGFETVNGAEVMYLYEDESLKNTDIPTDDPNVTNNEYKYQFGAPENINGFAIVTSPNEVTSTVVDDDGNTVEQELEYGGKVLLLCNRFIEKGEPLFGYDSEGKPRKIYFNVLPN